MATTVNRPAESEKRAESGKRKEPTRLNINISSEEARILQRLSSEQGTSVTNVVRRAIQVYEFLEDNLGDKKNVLQLVNKEKGEVTTLAIV